jgi:hypothetical protein
VAAAGKAPCSDGFLRTRAGTLSVVNGVTRKRKAGTSPKPRHSRGRHQSKLSKTEAKTYDDLAMELCALVRLVLIQFGFTAARVERALKRSRGLAAAPRISGPLMRDSMALGEMLLEWSRKAPYVDASGKPKVLDIQGSGDTFESLAIKHLPDLPLKRVIRMACDAAEVVLRPANKIALLGSIMVSVAKANDNLYLAHAIQQVDQLLQTSLHNRRVAGKGRDEGRMERMVTGIISRGEYQNFMRELRPQIYDLLQRIDSSVEHRQPTTEHALNSATAVSVVVFVAQEDDLERIGADPGPLRRQISSRKPPS